MAFSLSHADLTFSNPDEKNTVTLTNNSDATVSYKARLTHPGSTTTKPSKGDVGPGQSVQFEVRLKGDMGELVGQSPRMLVQCCDDAGAVIWKQRLSLVLGFQGGAAAPTGSHPAAANISVDTVDSISDSSPVSSPVALGAGAPAGAFSIAAVVSTLTSPVPLTGGAYAVRWKRGGQEGTSRPVGPAGNAVHFNHDVSIPNCVAAYKDGKALKKHLVFTVEENGEAVGTVKIQTSEYTAQQMSGDVPINLTINGVQHQASLELVLNMQQGAPAPAATLAAAATATAAAPTSVAAAPSAQPPRAPGAKPAGAARTFVDVSAVPNSGATGGNASPQSSELHNPLEEGLAPIAQAPLDQNIQVLVRVRPGSSNVWNVDTRACSISDDEKSHQFDRVMDTTSKNIDMWQVVGPRFIDAVTSGINGTIFMYGQTGSGKTHTMFGAQGEEGLTSMLFSHLFDRIQNLTTPTMSFTVTASYFEIYNEALNDLLVTDPKKGRDLRIRQKGEAFGVPDLIVQEVKTIHDCSRLLELGGSRKVMGYSNLNTDSSRSHTIFSISVVCDTVHNGQKKKKTATLNFCDLAGSETMNMEGDKGQKAETVNINTSLTYLKLVIQQLAEKSKHVMYRNSSLTRILKQSLGGNARTSVIITIHPGREQQKDSKNSLWFGSMARTVKNRAKINEEVDDVGLRQLVKRLQGDIKNKEEELEVLRRVRDDYISLQAEYTLVCEENNMLKSGASVQQTLEHHYGVEGLSSAHPTGSSAQPVPSSAQAAAAAAAAQAQAAAAAQAANSGNVAAAVPAGDPTKPSQKETALLKALSEKDREIVDLKLRHSKELMAKTIQLQRALAEQEQEETALELMQKDDRLDKLVHEILSYLHYGTKTYRLEGKGTAERRLLYLTTEVGHQHICICPLDASMKGLKDQIIEKIATRDVKRIVMGQYGGLWDKTHGSMVQQFDQSFSIIGKKGKRIDVACDTPSDFEAWVQSLNYLTNGVKAEWGSTLKIDDLPEAGKLDDEEQLLCKTMHIQPIDYLHARSQIVNKEGKFITLFDVRTLSCIDMYHSQKLFAFFMTKGWIGQRKLYYLDTEMIAKTPGVYDVEYEDDDEEEDEPQQQQQMMQQQQAVYQPPPGGYSAAPAPSSQYSAAPTPSGYG